LPDSALYLGDTAYILGVFGECVFIFFIVIIVIVTVLQHFWILSCLLMALTSTQLQIVKMIFKAIVDKKVEGDVRDSDDDD
jgi:glucan phosphoethanolaminetransferase (alkaline phosphatase superfamily)